MTLNGRNALLTEINKNSGAHQKQDATLTQGPPRDAPNIMTSALKII